MWVGMFVARFVNFHTLSPIQFKGIVPCNTYHTQIEVSTIIQLSLVNKINNKNTFDFSF